MIKMFFIIFFLTALNTSSTIYAAVGCTLNDPDRDIRRIFPKSTGYKTEFITVEEKGGLELFGKIETKLGDKLDSVYETIDVPYAYYTVLRGKDKIGYVHGVNQKGMFGGIQLILATDLDGKILSFYYQKLSSPESRSFKKKDFTNKFKGLTLANFYKYGSDKNSNPLNNIQNPTKNSVDDFKATLRGIKKNLILLDEFYLNNKYDDFLQKKE